MSETLETIGFIVAEILLFFLISILVGIGVVVAAKVFLYIMGW